MYIYAYRYIYTHWKSVFGTMVFFSGMRGYLGYITNIYIYIQICSFLLRTQEHPAKEPEELGAEAKDTGECGRGNKGVWKGAGNQKKHAGRPLIYGGFWPGSFELK